MIQIPKELRKRARLMARLGVVLSSVMLVSNISAMFEPPGRAAAAGTDLGAVQLLTPSTAASPNQPVTSGGSSTVFVMTPPSGASCPGGATGTPSYRWQTYMVADAIDVANLAFASGPVAVGASFVSPLYETPSGDPITNQNPAASPLGLIPGVPPISFGAFAPGAVPAGDYKIGVACSQAGATVSFWSTRITVTTAAADTPAGFTWALATTPVTTTTAAATTTTAAATTTTRQGTTTTTVHAATSTTAATTTTAVSASTTTAVASTTTLVASASGTTTSTTRVASTNSSGATLVTTGSSPLPIIVWALLLLVFGRMVILLARPVRVVRPPDSR